MDSVEAQITKLNNEIRSLKSDFVISASNIKIYTKSIEFTTSHNPYRFSSPTGSFSGYYPERVIVTFNTNSGFNTLAKLEVNSNGKDNMTNVIRMPYSGGARWMVSRFVDSIAEPESLSYTFTVQSMVDGSLSARMIWQ